MKATRVMSVLALGLVLVLVGTTDAAMFQDFMSSVAKVSSASPAGYGYGSEVVELMVDSYSNCAMSDSIAWAETHLVCADAYGAEYTTPGRQTSDPAAVCEWHFIFFDYPPSLPVSGTTQKRIGKVFGDCELTEALNHCGPECAGMTISIEAWLHDVPAWFKTRYMPTLLSDLALSGCGSGSNSEHVPSCCILQYSGLFDDQEVCEMKNNGGCRAGSGKGSTKAGAGTPTAGAKQGAAGAGNSKRTPPADSLADVVADGSKKAAILSTSTVPTCNGDHSYYIGSAFVAHGAFIIQHAHHSHKWESKGKMSWVVGTHATNCENGPYPETKFEAEAGKLHLKFFKSGEYGYGYDHPKHYDDGSKPYDKYDGPKHYDEPKPYDDGPKHYDDGPHERRRRRF